MASLYHILLLALGTVSLTQGKPYGNIGGYGGRNCGGSEFEDCLYESDMTYQDEDLCSSDCFENEYCTDEASHYIAEDEFSESSSNCDKVCDSTTVSKSIRSDNTYNDFDYGSQDYNSLNEFGENYVAGNDYFSEQLGGNQGGYRRGGLGGFGNSGYESSQNDVVNEGSNGYGSLYDNSIYGRGSSGSSSYVEDEVVTTTNESESCSDYATDSRSYVDSGSSLSSSGLNAGSNELCSSSLLDSQYNIEECESEQTEGCVGGYY